MRRAEIVADVLHRYQRVGRSLPASDRDIAIARLSTESTAARSWAREHRRAERLGVIAVVTHQSGVVCLALSVPPLVTACTVMTGFMVGAVVAIRLRQCLAAALDIAAGLTDDSSQPR